MKQKIGSISLLLSFLVVLSHEMIPHHHHDSEEYDISFQSVGSEDHHHSDDLFHFHHDGEKHNHGTTRETEEKHRHHFPFHQHLSADHDYIVYRPQFKRDSIANFTIVAVLFETITFKLPPTPKIDLIRFTNKPFLITSIFEPGAIGLRAPPSIA